MSALTRRRAMMEMSSASRDFPDPGVGASIRWMGVGPSNIRRANGSNNAATAWALSDSAVNGKSTRRSSRISDKAASTSSAVGRPEIAYDPVPSAWWSHRLA